MKLKFTSFLLLGLLFSMTALAQNTGLSFNGTNTTVSTSAFVVPTSGDFTVEFWYTMASLGSGLEEFVSQGSVGTGFYIGTDGINGNFRCGDAFQGTGVAVPLNQWTHVALVNSAGTATLYINGVPLGSTAGYSFTAGGDFFTVGNQFGGLTEFTTATMDQIRVWSVALTARQVKTSMYLPVSPAAPGLIADYEMNEGTGTTMGNSTATTGLDGTLNNSPAWVNSPIQYASNALTFDGVSTFVLVPPSPVFDISSGTIEAWINPSTLNATNMEIVGNRFGGNTRYSFHVSATQIGMWNGTTFGTLNVSIPTNTWTELAFVCDGTNTTVYVNGASAGVIPEAFSTATGLFFDIGISKNAGIDGEAFQGSIDEVRVWSTQQSPAQITSNMNVTLSGTEPGLVALYTFDQGNPGNDNTGILTAIDNTANNNNGTLFNFALTGTTSNFTTHSLPLPVNFTSFTATKAGGQALLRWQTAQEQNSLNFTVERSTNGVNFSSIGEMPAAGNSSTPKDYSFTDAEPAQGINYYRLKEVDLDLRSMYSTVRTVVFSKGGAQKLVWYIVGGKTAEVDLQNGSNEFYTLNDIDGHLVQKGQLSSGKLYLNLTGGIYIVRVNSFSGQVMTTKVLIP
jgi:hypothetical protein